MAQTQVEKDYIKSLKELVSIIQRGNSNEETLKLLADAKKWGCYGYEDRLLLDELIENAEEYLKLESKSLIPFNYTKEELERRSFLVSWFNEISFDLKNYDSTLYQIYYFNKYPSEQFKFRINQFSN